MKVPEKYPAIVKALEMSSIFAKIHQKSWLNYSITVVMPSFFLFKANPDCLSLWNSTRLICL
jgi:hypothetical protein